MLKRSAAIVLALTFISIAMVPETLANHRNRRAGFYRPAVTRSYYSPYAYNRVAGSRYYNSQPYYQGIAGTRYDGRRFDGRRFDGRRFDGRRFDRGRSTRNLVLTVAAPAAIGAGIGAITRGGKGAGIGALIGGGGGALYYLLRNRSRRY